MEVHHHSHSDRKKWTHYFWEFLMLFLAIFCGFLAEYQLEHKIEKEKGRQYVKSFYEDLKKDTAFFRMLIQNYQRKLEGLETRGQCFDTVYRDPLSADCLKTLFGYSGSFPNLIHTERTLQQLKNAGGMRMLATDDADSILEYDNSLKTYTYGEVTYFQEIQSAIRNTVFSLVNYQHRRPTGASRNRLLVTNHQELLNRFFNLLERYTRLCGNNAEDIAYLNSKATNLLHYFKQKYHLK